MLKLAYKYSYKLAEVYDRIITDKKYDFYFSRSWSSYNIKIDDGDYDRIQFVSVNYKDEVIGYFAATLDRITNKVGNIGIMNFKDKNITFSKDLCTFLSSLFDKYKFDKIEWCVTIGNPAEKMYDKLVKKCNGHIVGIYHKTIKCKDGVIRDEKLYEVFKEDYERSKFFNKFN